MSCCSDSPHTVRQEVTVMQEPVVVIIGILIAAVVIKWFAKPLKLLLRIGFNSIAGTAVLFCFNFFQGFTGMTAGINLFSVLLTGFLGIPGAVLLLFLGKFL